MSYIKTDASRHMKNSALEKIEREYAKSRCQSIINQEQKEDLIFNCVMEKK